MLGRNQTEVTRSIHFRKTETGFDHILMVAKYFVYKSRINKTRPRVQGFLKELTHMYKTDKYMHSILMKQEKFALKWLAYQDPVEGP